jgi:hypothetical protein
MGASYGSEVRENETKFTASESTKLPPVPTTTTMTRAVMISLMRVHLSVLISLASQVSPPLASSGVQLWSAYV